MKLAMLAAGLLLFSSIYLTAQVTEFHVKIELIPESAAVEAGKPFWVGLLFRLDEGWHIYWQNPGDAGEPPKVQWQLPPGFTSGSILWPQPVRIGTGSVVDYGYENQILLMTPIQRAAGSTAGSTSAVSADVKYIVCREMCIPGKAHVALSSPPSGQQVSAQQSPAQRFSEWRQLFEQTRAQIPKPAPKAWKFSARAETGKDKNDHFILSVQTESKVHAATFFPFEPGQIENSAPQTFAATGDGFRLSLKKSDLLVKPISSLKGLLVLGPGRAYEITAPVARR